MDKIIFSLLKSAKVSETKICTREYFDGVIDSAEVAGIVDKISQCLEKEHRSELKKLLPVFCYHASFPDGKRSNSGAKASGLFMTDLDHSKEDVAEVWKRIEEKLSVEGCRWKVYLAHRTPSGDGLRLVVRCLDGMGVPDCQKEFCEEMGLVNDPAVKDLARCSFAVPRSYFFRIDYSIFTDDVPELPAEGCEKVCVKEVAEGLLPVADVEQLSFDGIPYEAVVDKLCERLGYQVIEEGVRNQTLFRLALLLRNVCDYKPRLLAKILPKTIPPLSADELNFICMSACRKEMDVRMPRILDEVVNSLRKESAAEDAAEEVAAVLPMPRLPKVFRIFVSLCQPEYAETMILSLLPVLGTLGTGISGVYNDNEPQRMNFQTLIVGPQASCKSRILKLATQHLLDSIMKEDEMYRAQEREYYETLRLDRKRKKKGKGEGEDLPPKKEIRIPPATLSVSKYLERQQNAQGKHLFSVENEIGTVANSNRAGAWANKLEIYKNAFDNELYGQDYRSEDSYSAVVPVAYNYLFAGTYAAVMEFYNKKAVMSGLGSRTIVAFVPETFASKRPKFKTLSAKDKEYLDGVVLRLRDFQGEVHCPKVAKAIDEWLDKCAVEAKKADDDAVDFFCRRSAIIGSRAGMLAYVLEGRKESKVVVDFAVWVAERVMRNQIALWGAWVFEGSSPLQSTVARKNIYDVLNAEFSYSDLRKVMGQGASECSVRKVISRWKKSGLIEKISANNYRKTEQQK